MLARTATLLCPSSRIHHPRRRTCRSPRILSIPANIELQRAVAWSQYSGQGYEVVLINTRVYGSRMDLRRVQRPPLI